MSSLKWFNLCPNEQRANNIPSNIFKMGVKESRVLLYIYFNEKTITTKKNLKATKTSPHTHTNQSQKHCPQNIQSKCKLSTDIQVPFSFLPVLLEKHHQWQQKCHISPKPRTIFIQLLLLINHIGIGRDEDFIKVWRGSRCYYLVLLWVSLNKELK